MASDAAFFHQTRAAIDSIRRSDGGDIDIRLIAIGSFDIDQLDWLAKAKVSVFDRNADIPRFNGGPEHSIALTCRPYIPQLFPEFDGFVWVDSDVRFLSSSGLPRWIARARDVKCPVAAVHEAESAYTVNRDSGFSRTYYRITYARMLEVYGQEAAEYFEYFRLYNAGLFAAPSHSPFWTRYRKNLERALSFPYDRLREQDAFNVAISECGVWAMPSTLNWLCSMSPPVLGPNGKWMPRDDSDRWIEVAHLTESTETVTHGGEVMTWYDCYRKLGLTE